MLISVWGSVSSGKSLFSTVMGRLLAESGKRTLIVYAGLLSNDTACFYPDEKNMVSMGNLFQSDIEDDEILNYMMTTDCNNLAYLTYAPGENIYSYPVFTKYNIVNSFSKLSSFFEFIIVDCSSDLNGGVISLTALEMADKVFRLMGASAKDTLYFMSNLSIISDSRFNLDEHICVLSRVKSDEPTEVYEKYYGGIAYRQYYDSKIYSSYMEGRLMNETKSDYENLMRKIIKENIYEELNTKKIKRKKEKEKRKNFFSKKREEDLDGRYDE